MKIRAIEVEHEGKVYRYKVDAREESTWPSAEGFKYGQPVVSYRNALDGKDYPLDGKDYPVVVGVTKCGCGHLESEHLPECIYKIEGCECSGYAKSTEG